MLMVIIKARQECFDFLIDGCIVIFIKLAQSSNALGFFVKNHLINYVLNINTMKLTEYT